MRYLTRYGSVMTKKRANLLLAGNGLISGANFIVRVCPVSSSFYAKFMFAMQSFNLAIIFIGCVLYIWIFCSMKRTVDRLNISDGTGVRQKATELERRPNKTIPTSKHDGSKGEVPCKDHHPGSNIESMRNRERSNITEDGNNVGSKNQGKSADCSIQMVSTGSSSDPCGMNLREDISSEPLTMHDNKPTRTMEYSNVTNRSSNNENKNEDKSSEYSIQTVRMGSSSDPCRMHLHKHNSNTTNYCSMNDNTQEGTTNVYTIQIISMVSSPDPWGMTLPEDKSKGNNVRQWQARANENVHNHAVKRAPRAPVNKPEWVQENRQASTCVNSSRNETRKHATLTSNQLEKDSENRQTNTYAKLPNIGKIKQANPLMNEPRQDRIPSQKPIQNQDGKQKPPSNTVTTTTQQNMRRRPYREFARAVFLIIIALIICYIPGLAVYFNGDAEDLKRGLSSYREYWVDVMVLLNSSLNAVIFITCNTELRMYTKSVLTRILCPY